MIKDWFETFSRQYFEDKYRYYYNYNHYRELHPNRKISNITIDRNKIIGSINDDYYSNNIEIEFKRFNEDEKSRILKTIDESTVNTFQIINKIIPQDLFNLGIEILPESLDDLEISCSSDNEESYLIDVLSLLKGFNKRLLANNFLIFEIKGLDIRKTTNYPVKNINDIFTKNFNTNSDNKTLHDLYDINCLFLQNVAYPTKSFTFIYSELFKIYKKEINAKSMYFDDLNISLKEITTIDLDKNYNISKNSEINNEKELFAFLNETCMISDNISFMRKILKLTYKLVRYNALMPEIFTAQDVGYIRWIPSFFDDAVLNLCKKYYPDCPDDLITFNGNKLSKENQVIALISLIMNGLIQYSIEKNKIKRDYRIPEIVFNLCTAKTSKSRNHVTFENISKNFYLFYMKELDFTYALFIDENLNIEVKIKKNDNYKTLNDANEDEIKYLKPIYDLFTHFKIKNRVFEPIKLTNHDFIIFNEKIKPVFEYINVELNSYCDIIESEFELILDTPLSEERFKLNEPNAYQWLIRLNDRIITIDEFDKNSDDMNGLIKTHDKLYIVDGYKFRVLKGSLWILYRLDNNKLLQLAFLKEYRRIKFEISEKLQNLINSSTIYDVPESLTGELRPYQKIGYSWLIQNVKNGFGSILADDMGLGKTVQVLSTILYFAENNPLEKDTVLIILPPTLISNWAQEIEKFTSSLSYYIYHGSNRKFPQERYDIILTSYGVIRIDLELFMDKEWFMCVIDEAQNIKNPSSQQTRAIKSLDAFNKIALTGTPIENRLLDYWSIFDFVNKGYLSTMSDFKSEYVTPIEKMENEDVLENLKKIAKPFVLRRLKSDSEIKKELPDKFVNDTYCSLTKKQIKLYNMILDGIFDNLEGKKGIERKGIILKTITSLKQVCNHPAQFLKTEKAKINESGKMELLITLLENILDSNEKVLIFTQYVKMGEIIEKLVSKKLKTDVLFLHGSQTLKEKTNIINKFQENQNYKILVATLKTGGTGLNLTAAQNVIHYDLWWNPAIENQATDRVHRIGQENDVMVYRFITKGTLEEHIDKIIKNKIDLAEKAISTDETFITEMSNEEIKEILKLRL